jgi:hypothetical protein
MKLGISTVVCGSFNDFFYFYIGGHFENFKKQSTTLSDNLFLCQVSKGSAVRFELNIFGTLVTMDHSKLLADQKLMKLVRNNIHI